MIAVGVGDSPVLTGGVNANISSANRLLLESGSFFLLEDGSFLLLEA